MCNEVSTEFRIRSRHVDSLHAASSLVNQGTLEKQVA